MENADFENPTTVQCEYERVFDVEVKSWCYALTKFNGELSIELVHRVVQEMKPVFQSAIGHNLSFDIIATASRIAKASGMVVSEKEAVMSILIHLPKPYELDCEAKSVLDNVVTQAEKAYGQVLEAMQERWAAAV